MPSLLELPNAEARKCQMQTYKSMDLFEAYGELMR